VPLPFKIIYSPKYHVKIGDHVFPTDKYLLVYNRLLREHLCDEKDFICPVPASKDDLLLVHTRDYVDKLLNGRMSTSDLMRLELPFSRELVEASMICVEGTIETCRYALKDGIGIHIGGGFHHSFPGHGEGFCVFNDVAVGIKKLMQEALIKKAMVVDCDLHHGNGTALIFQNDKSVFTFSIHQENNYPVIKPPSDIDVGLYDGTGDKEYLENLNKHIPLIINEFKPQLLVYVAGADPYENDKLGGLLLTLEGLKARDEVVFNACKANNVSVASVLAGGYATDVQDTVTIHYNMIKGAIGLWK